VHMKVAGARAQGGKEQSAHCGQTEGSATSPGVCVHVINIMGICKL
jgi:hypothetical protein